MKNKCPKTMSGKHKWGEYYDGVNILNNMLGTIATEPKYIVKCKGCGMVYDLNKEIK